MNPEDADRLGLLASMKELTMIINGISGGWLLLYNSPVISQLSRADFADMFNFQKETTLKLLKQGLTLQKIFIEKSQDELMKGYVT